MITSVCSPQQSSCYWTRSNIRRQLLSLLLKLWPMSESLPPATITRLRTKPEEHIIQSYSVQRFSSLSLFHLCCSENTFSAHNQKKISEQCSSLSCLSCISAAPWLCFMFNALCIGDGCHPANRSGATKHRHISTNQRDTGLSQGKTDLTFSCPVL